MTTKDRIEFKKKLRPKPVEVELKYIKGEKGDRGLPGKKGDKGDKGLAGANGLNGKNGRDGVDGTNGLNGDRGLQGVKGDKGDKGDRGERGPRGAGSGSNRSAASIVVSDIGDNYNGTNVEDVLAEIGETSRKNGYDLTKPDSLPDLAFDNSTRTFSVSVKSEQSNFYFWADNKKIIKTTTQSVVIPDITKTYYIIFDSLGDLIVVPQDAIVSSDFYEHAITGLVYWNATTQTGMAGDERHGSLMDARTHHYNHSTFGARYESGMDINGLAKGSSTYTRTTSGFFWDEDIRHIIGDQSTHPFIYRLGSNGEWTSVVPDNNIGYSNGTSNIVWNEWTGTTWQLTESNYKTDYMIYFMMATPDITGYSLKKIIGQHGYSSRNKARDAIGSELHKIITDGLPSPEFIFLYAYIVARDGDLEEMDDEGNLYLDLRTLKGGVGGTGSTSNAAAYVHLQIDTTQDMGGANGTVHYVDWDGIEIHKDATFTHNILINPSRIQVNVTGRYSLYWDVGITQGGSARTTYMSAYRIDGSDIITRGRQRNYSRGSNYGDTNTGMVTELDLTAGQYIECNITIDDADGAYVSNTINAECELIMRKLD